jgi:hypothetical protein
MQERFNVSFPLLLGADSLKNGLKHNAVETVSTVDVECSITLSAQSMLQCQQQQHENLRWKVKDRKFTNNLLQAGLELSAELSDGVTNNRTDKG